MCVPYAMLLLYYLDSSIDMYAVVTLSDTLLTGFKCSVRNAGINLIGLVVIVSTGPIGIVALLIACLKKPTLIVIVDLDDT